MTTEQWLDLCHQYRMYTLYHRSRWFVALGDFYGFGKTVPEAIENWCQAVEQKLEVSA